MKAIESLHGQKLEFRRPLCTCIIDSYVSHACLAACFHIIILEKKNRLSWFLLHEFLPRMVHRTLDDEINPESALNQA